MKFMCGCNPIEKVNYRCEEVSDGRGGKVLTSHIIDSQGYEVCPEHGERLENWRSPQIQTANGPKILYSSMANNRTLGDISSSAEDRRFNDDPTEFGKLVLAQRRVERNGHSNGNTDGERRESLS